MKKNRNRPRGEESRIASRRLKVMRLRQRGWSLRRISEALGVSLQTVANDLNACLSELIKTTTQETAHYRQLELERLDSLLEGIWGKAVGGSVYHIDRCLMIMERRAKFLNLDTPAKLVVAGDKEKQLTVEHKYSISDELLAKMHMLAGLASPRSDKAIDITPVNSKV
jgi:hypothetical protein